MSERNRDMDQEFNKTLEMWAKADLADDAAVERLVAGASAMAAGTGTDKTAPARKWWPWTAGAVAASLAAALLVFPMSDMRPDEPATGIEQPLNIALADEDAAIDSFALLYSTTFEEEEYI